MKTRKRLSRFKSKRVFNKGINVNGKNNRRMPMRGGYRL